MQAYVITTRGHYLIHSLPLAIIAVELKMSVESI